MTHKEEPMIFGVHPLLKGIPNFESWLRGLCDPDSPECKIIKANILLHDLTHPPAEEEE